MSATQGTQVRIRPRYHVPAITENGFRRASLRTFFTGLPKQTLARGWSDAGDCGSGTLVITLWRSYFNGSDGCH